MKRVLGTSVCHISAPILIYCITGMSRERDALVPCRRAREIGGSNGVPEVMLLSLARQFQGRGQLRGKYQPYGWFSWVIALDDDWSGAAWRVVAIRRRRVSGGQLLSAYSSAKQQTLLAAARREGGAVVSRETAASAGAGCQRREPTNERP